MTEAEAQAITAICESDIYDSNKVKLIRELFQEVTARGPSEAALLERRLGIAEDRAIAAELRSERKDATIAELEDRLEDARSQIEALEAKIAEADEPQEVEE